jgi:hypothetical protein
MVADDGVAVGIYGMGSTMQSVQFLFPVSDGRAAILIYGSRPTSGNVE